MSDPWLWGDGSEILWGDGETLGDDGFSLLSTGTTWNPADKSADITLSNGNLTASSNGTGTGFYSVARSTEGKSSGKVYFECAADAFTAAGDYAAIALATTAASLDSAGSLLGTATIDDSAYYADGNAWHSGNNTALTAYASGDVLGCAVDLAAGKGWFSKNGLFASGDPAAGTGEHFTFTAGAELFAAFNFLVGGTDQTTARFAAADQTYAPPAGFVAWDEEAVVEGAAEAAPLTYGAAPRALYERKVRAFWEEREELERQRQAAEQEQRARDERMRELQRQQAELDERRRTESRKSAVAKRRAKLAREIAEIEAANAAAQAEIDQLVAQINAAIAAQELQADRRRRMVLLLAASA